MMGLRHGPSPKAGATSRSVSGPDVFAAVGDRVTLLVAARVGGKVGDCVALGVGVDVGVGVGLNVGVCMIVRVLVGEGTSATSVLYFSFSRHNAE